MQQIGQGRLGKKEKTKKRIKIAIVITSILVMMIGVYMAFAFIAFLPMPNGFYYYDFFSYNGFIKDYVAGKTAKSISIPKSLFGMETCWVDFTFITGNTDLVSLSVPEGVVALYDSINLHSREETAFGSCTSLEYNIYENGCYLGNEENPYQIFVKPLQDNYLTFTSMHENTKVVAPYAFINNEELVSVTIPKNVVFVERSAFTGCERLQEVCVKNEKMVYEVTTVGDTKGPKKEYGIICSCLYKDKGYNDNFMHKEEGMVLGSFCRDEKDSNLSYENDFVFFTDPTTKEKTLVSYTGSNEAVVVPSVKSIGKNAFWNRKGITSLVLPEGVEVIGKLAFSGCALTSISIPKSLRFMDPTNVVIFYEDGEYDVLWDQSPFYNCTGLKDVFYGGSKSDWKWSSFVSSAVVHCSDGNLNEK